MDHHVLKKKMLLKKIWKSNIMSSKFKIDELIDFLDCFSYILFLYFIIAEKDLVFL